MLSGDISTDTLREIARQGRVYLGKPVTAPALLHLIRELSPVRSQHHSPPITH